jgi:hypothetical protein
MSPQMNGEPREVPLSEPNYARDGEGSTLVAHNADLPLPPAINADRVTKTPVTEEQPLAPLFNEGATSDFRARWDLVQRSFVDDPRAAVTAADELVGQVTKTLADMFAEQRSSLEKGFGEAKAPTTENLRIALRQYRSFFERLLTI